MPGPTSTRSSADTFRPSADPSEQPAWRVREWSSDPRQRLAREGERAAEQALRRAGLTILERRYRVRLGEIDLIASRGDLLVFVEVKTRRGTRYGPPAHAVTAIKRRRMARVAQVYLQRTRQGHRPCRFDVVEVFAGPGGIERVTHHEDAFRIWPTG